MSDTIQRLSAAVDEQLRLVAELRAAVTDAIERAPQARADAVRMRIASQDDQAQRRDEPARVASCSDLMPETPRARDASAAADVTDVPWRA